MRCPFSVIPSKQHCALSIPLFPNAHDLAAGLELWQPAFGQLGPKISACLPPSASETQPQFFLVQVFASFDHLVRCPFSVIPTKQHCALPLSLFSNFHDLAAGLELWQPAFGQLGPKISACLPPSASETQPQFFLVQVFASFDHLVRCPFSVIPTKQHCALPLSLFSNFHDLAVGLELWQPAFGQLGPKISACFPPSASETQPQFFLVQVFSNFDHLVRCRFSVIPTKQHCALPPSLFSNDHDFCKLQL